MYPSVKVTFEQAGQLSGMSSTNHAPEPLLQLEHPVLIDTEMMTNPTTKKREFPLFFYEAAFLDYVLQNSKNGSGHSPSTGKTFTIHNLQRVDVMRSPTTVDFLARARQRLSFHAINQGDARVKVEPAGHNVSSGSDRASLHGAVRARGTEMDGLLIYVRNDGRGFYLQEPKSR